MSEISRRELITGATATAATIAFGPILISPASLSAQGSAIVPIDPEVDARSHFRDLSATLTGIDRSILAPNVDPSGFNKEVFDRAKATDAATLTTILTKFIGDPTNSVPPKTVAEILAEDTKEESAKFLMRSIILAWYLGAWYQPKDLRAHSYRPRGSYYSTRRYSTEILIPYEVLSPRAYTNSMVWRIAQAHPMGYSNLQFGYWGQEPPSLGMFIRPLKPDSTEAGSI